MVLILGGATLVVLFLTSLIMIGAGGYFYFAKQVVGALGLFMTGLVIFGLYCLAPGLYYLWNQYRRRRYVVV